MSIKIRKIVLYSSSRVQPLEDVLLTQAAQCSELLLKSLSFGRGA